MAVSIPSGTYNIFNAAFNAVIDLAGEDPTENTPVIGFSLNNPPTGNQQWKLTNLPNTTIYTMQNVNPGTFVRALGDNLVPGNLVVGSQNNTPVSIESVGNDQFMIKVPNVNLAFALATAELRARVTLDEINNAANQFWVFKPVRLNL